MFAILGTKGAAITTTIKTPTLKITEEIRSQLSTKYRGYHFAGHALHYIRVMPNLYDKDEIFSFYFYLNYCKMFCLLFDFFLSLKFVKTFVHARNVGRKCKV